MMGIRRERHPTVVMAPGDRELLVLAVVVMVVVIWRVLPSVDAVELLAWLPAGRCRCRRRRKLAALSAACFQIVVLKTRTPPRNPERSGAGNPRAFGRAPPTPFSTPYGDGCLEQQPTAGGLDTHAPPLPLPATAPTPGSIHHTTPPTTGPHYAPGPRKTGAEKRS